MLFSRFWIVLLAAVAGLSVAAMTLARKTYDHDREQDVASMVESDRRLVDEAMRRDARSRIDDLAPLASDSALVGLMETASRRTDDSTGAIGTRITTRLRELNTGLGAMRGEILFAVDPRGVVVGRTGLNENEVGQYVGGLPLVERAIAGNVRDDLWDISGTAYRMAARPVISQGRYLVGAVVHGMSVQQRFVETMAQLVPGASVLFFGPEGTYAGFTPIPERGAVAAPPIATLGDQVRAAVQRDDWKQRGATAAFTLPEHGGVVVYASLPGLVGAAGGGIALGRSAPTMPSDFLMKASKEDMARVPWAMIIGAVVALSLLGMLLVYIEYDSKKKRLVAAFQALTKGPGAHLDPLTLSGFARDAAVAANDAIDAVVKREVERSGGRLRDVGALENLLGPAEPGMPAAPVNTRKPMSADEEQRHWREVYEQFMAKRRETGEPTDLAWDRFTQTLQRNKEQVQSKVTCKGVRFQAMVKDGRATLRATPVR